MKYGEAGILSQAVMALYSGDPFMLMMLSHTGMFSSGGSACSGGSKSGVGGANLGAGGAGMNGYGVPTMGAGMGGYGGMNPMMMGG